MPSQTEENRATQQHSPFMTLSQELREQIYAHLLIPSSGFITIIRPNLPPSTSRNGRAGSDNSPPGLTTSGSSSSDIDGFPVQAAIIRPTEPIDVSILRASTRIHDEAAALLYSRAKFFFSAGRTESHMVKCDETELTLRAFIDTVPTTYRSLMRNIWLDGVPTCHDFVQLIRKFFNLAKLTAGIPCPVFYIRRRPVPLFWREIDLNIRRLLIDGHVDTVSFIARSRHHQPVGAVLRSEAQFNAVLGTMLQQGCRLYPRRPHQHQRRPATRVWADGANGS